MTVQVETADLCLSCRVYIRCTVPEISNKSGQKNTGELCLQEENWEGWRTAVTAHRYPCSSPQLERAELLFTERFPHQCGRSHHYCYTDIIIVVGFGAGLTFNRGQVFISSRANMKLMEP